MATQKPILAITSGDPNGVGYEVVLRSLSNATMLELCTPVVYGNLKAAQYYLHTLDESLHGLHFEVIRNAEEAKPGHINLISCYADMELTPGQSTAEGGKASFACLDRAVKDLKAGKVHALVTAPINKDNIQSEQFHFSGHTEYLTEQFSPAKQESLMMMVSAQLRVALACNHTPIAKVPMMLSEERILRKLALLNETLKHDFGVRRPRIAVLSLNPHAGDNGLIGEEEQTTIKPAVEKATEQGIYAFGPYAADGFFGTQRYRQFDAVLAMYHDQGLAPFKTISMDGVNYTAGLPIVRTSPDHGTAYDLAGKNKADEQSMNHAIYMAIDMLRARALDKEINKNPLVIEEREQRERPERFPSPFPPTPFPVKGQGEANS